MSTEATSTVVRASAEPAESPAVASSLSLSGSFFLYFAIVGITQPYLPAYLKSLGLSGVQTGVLLALAPLIAIVGPPLWGALADRSGRPTVVLNVIVLGAGCSLLPMLFARRFESLLLTLAVYALFTSSMTTMLDSLAIQRVARVGGSYPRIRLFGSLGYIVASWLFGLWVTTIGITVVVVSLVIWGIALLWSLTVRAEWSVRARPNPLTGLRLLRRRDLRLLLTASALHWLCCAPHHTIFGIHVLSLGLTPRVVGECFGLGVVAELGVMYLYPNIARRWSTKTLLTATFLATAFRWAVLSVASSELPLAAASLLHGFTFGVFYSSMIAAVSARVPAELRATGQALFAATTSGIGGFVGYVVTGALSDHVSGHVLFGLAAAGELIPLLLITRLDSEKAPG